MILGIDEAGRGPWAGPLVVGAVVLGGVQIDGLDDSKKLSKKRREALYLLIIEQAAATATGWVTVAELDQIGMSEALRIATRRAVEQIHVPYHQIIIDGTVNFLSGTTKGDYVKTLPKADALIPSVSAASIIAKVERDRYMAEQDALYPGYGFARHAGYGVKAHREAIAHLGVTPLHRLSFAPLQGYANGGDLREVQHSEQPVGSVMSSRQLRNRLSTRDIGNASEDAAANELMRRGHDIIARNWRTKYCEIDIVSRQQGTYYFVEVKHRKTDTSGDGLAAITARKQRQMKFAAEYFAVAHQLRDTDLRLMAIATTGNPPVITQLIELE